jgi:eukaryotic-like serine/threonine-protein kinase
MRGDVAPDTVVDGRYRLLERLGSGGMAEVYCAQDLQLGRRVALKLLYRRFAEDSSFVERFRREASAAAGLQHPNVVSVYDRGEWDGTSYIAMELVDGRTLRELVQEDGPVDPVRAIDFTIGVLRAARFAHRRGIIHRDIKPHNILVDREERAKVTDFGIARAGASDMTETGSIMGTAQYLSPEQAQGEAVTPQSDLYAVGVLLYELLTGRVPFDGDSAVSIALKQVSEPPVPPSSIDPSIPPELDAIVLRAMEKDPARRFPDADTFIAALDEVRTRLTGQTTTNGGHVRHAQIPPPPPLPPHAPPEPAHRGRRRWPWAVVVGLLAAAGAAAALLLTSAGQARVPHVVGRDVAVATQRLREAGFEVDARRAASEQPRDRVIDERPRGGARAKKGSTIRITVSDGPGIAGVPEVAGQPRSRALALLRKAGFHVREDKRSDENVGDNRAIGTRPTAGTQRERGTTVTLIVSTGPPLRTVPGVVGQSRDDAAALLGDRGFEVATTEREDEKADAGTVLAQTPLGGVRSPKGSTVTLVIARKPPKRAVPDVAGKTLAEATAILGRAGFRVTAQEQDVTDQTQDGRVVRQSPSAGRQVRRGAEVTLVIGRFTQPATPTTPAPPSGTDQSGTGAQGQTPPQQTPDAQAQQGQQPPTAGSP